MFRIYFEYSNTRNISLPLSLSREQQQQQQQWRQQNTHLTSLSYPRNLMR